MFVGKIKSASDSRLDCPGLVIPFEYENGDHILMLSGREMDLVAMTALTGTRLGASQQPELSVHVGDQLDPTHRIDAQLTVADRGSLNTVTIFRTIDQKDFSGVVFSASREMDTWIIGEIEKGTELDYLKWLAHRLSHKALKSSSTVQAEALRISESDLADKRGIETISGPNL